MEQVMLGVKQMSIDEDNLDPDDNEIFPKEGSVIDADDLPNVLIIANVDDSVFENPQSKAHFEAVFRDCDPDIELHYLKSFRRVRVIFTSSILAAQAKIQLHQVDICGRRIKVYFAMPITTKRDCSAHLLPPAPEKQFLISPPASPPIGWEPVNEGHPVINYDLISAIARLQPGEAHELHAPSSSQPGIVVHICEDPIGFDTRPTMEQTRRPDRRS